MNWLTLVRSVLILCYEKCEHIKVAKQPKFVYKNYFKKLGTLTGDRLYLRNIRNIVHVMLRATNGGSEVRGNTAPLPVNSASVLGRSKSKRDHDLGNWYSVHEAARYSIVQLDRRKYQPTNQL